MARIGVGVLGCGTVGSAVLRRMPADVDVVAVAVRDPGRRRPCPLPAVVTDDVLAVVDDPRVDVVVELLGAPAVAAPAIERTIASGRPVVTANKAVLATDGPRLRALASPDGFLGEEGAVLAGVPAVRLVRALAAGDRISGLDGVLNGTCAFVLGLLDRGIPLDEALAAAVAAGFAEADPTRDVAGLDAADKLAVLAQHAFGTATTPADVDVVGIDWLTPADAARARRRGRRWRLVASARRDRCCRVEPVELPEDHPFAVLDGATGALTVVADGAGPVTVTGAGAGGESTATAVLADLALAAAHLRTRAVATV